MNTISPLAFVHPNAKIGDNNIIGPFCYIDDNTVIGDNNKLLNSVTIHTGARIGNGNEFFPGASISTKPQDLKFRGEESLCEIGDNNSIREKCNYFARYSFKGNDNCRQQQSFYGKYAHCPRLHYRVNIIIGNSTKLAGEVKVEDYAIISASVLCHQFCSIGCNVMIQGGSRFSQDIPPYIIAGKEPIRYAGINIIGLRRKGFSNDQNRPDT